MPIEQIYPDLLEQEDLTFRVYTMDDADELSLAVGSSYEALRQWFPWAKPILSVGEAEALCEKFEHDFRDGKDFSFGVWDRGTFVGGGVYHPTDEEYKVEAEIWIRSTHTFKGLATRTLESMLQWGFRQWEFDSITLKCPLDVPASTKVAEKVGLFVTETRPGGKTDVHGTPRDANIFVVEKQDWKDSF